MCIWTMKLIRNARGPGKCKDSQSCLNSNRMYPARWSALAAWKHSQWQLNRPPCCYHSKLIVRSTVMQEVDVGLAADVGSLQRLPHIIGNGIQSSPKHLTAKCTQFVLNDCCENTLQRTRIRFGRSSSKAQSRLILQSVQFSDVFQCQVVPRSNGQVHPKFGKHSS